MSQQQYPSLAGKTAVVTGGNSGIGLAAVKALVAQGVFVFVVGRQQQTIDEAVAAVGGAKHAVGIRADVAKLADIDAVYAAVAARGAKLDIVVANAGIAEAVPTALVTEEHFDRLFDVNVRGAYFTVQKALPLLNDGASVILVGSIVSTKGFPGYSVYSATKAALRSFARTWTAEFKGDRKIRFNVLSPGPIDTPIFARQFPDKAVADGVRTSFAAMVPAGRFGDDTEIASAVLFLASDASSFVLGADLLVDGGITAV